MTRSKIYFVHEGRESYPEIDAYRRYFEPTHDTQEIFPSDLTKAEDLSNAICWMIMGFHPQRPAARIVIHDYRSLSIGKTREVKDWVKRVFNARPDIRIFQNDVMAQRMGFADGAPTSFLPMGVPASVLRFRRQKEKPVKACDFCYIGVMSHERRTETMFNSFLRRYGETKTLHTYGNPEPSLRDRYQDHANIIFHGRKPQEEVFAALQAARAAVNYFPTHLPHALQTPTKFLEYGALGLRVISNEHPRSREAAQTFGFHSLWGPAEDMFANAPDDLVWETNAHVDPTTLLWPAVIEKSGIAALLETIEAQK